MLGSSVPPWQPAANVYWGGVSSASLLQVGQNLYAPDLPAESGWVWDFTRHFHLLNFFSFCAVLLSSHCRVFLVRTFSLRHTKIPVSGILWRKMLDAWGHWTGYPTSYLLSQGPRTSIPTAHSWGISGLENQFCVNTLCAKNHGTCNSLQPQACWPISKAR